MRKRRHIPERYDFARFGHRTMPRTASSRLVIAIAALVASPIAAQSPVAQRAIAQSSAFTRAVAGSGDFLVADGRSVWMTNESRVERWSPTSATATRSVTLAEPCGAPAIAANALWVADCDAHALVRIDLLSGKVVARVPMRFADAMGEMSLAVGAGSVWVLTDSTGILSRVDIATNTITATIKVAAGSFAAAYGYDAVWITNTGLGPIKGTKGPGAVQRISPATNSVVATIPVGPRPRFLAVGEGGVWTLNQGDGSVSRVDPVKNTLAATIAVGVPGTGGDIATGLGHVWVRASKILLTSIDARTNAIVDRYGPPAGSGAVRVAGDLVWVTAHDTHTMWGVRPPMQRR